MKRNKAFTLLEVLLAVAIASVVMMVVLRSVSFGLRTYKEVQGAVFNDTVRLLDQLSRDLRCAYLTSLDLPDVRFVGSVSSMNFVTTSKLDQTKEYDIEAVRYYLERREGSGVFNFKYTKQPFLSTVMKSLSKKDSAPRNYLLSAWVQSLRFEYFDGKDWRESWSSHKDLPKAVKVSVSFKRDQKDKKTQELSTIISLPVT